MKAAAVDYVRPNSLDEAIALYGRASGEAQLIAGGQSLVAMMNLRLATPTLVIDIARLPELLAISEGSTSVTLGAGITHAAIEDGKVPDPSRGLMPRAATGIAYRAIRTRGTLGGSLALADPAAEWPVVMNALGATLNLVGPSGRRSLAAVEFATGIYETQLGPGEIVESVTIPKLSADARCGYIKLCRKAGEFASALAVAVCAPAVEAARIVIGAANGPPLSLSRAARLLAAGTFDTGELHAAVSADLHGAENRHFSEFQRNLHEVAAMRAIRGALQ